MKIIWFFIILSLILIPITINESNALQEIAGKITVNIKPGETKTFKWGLISDSDSNVTLGISATGKGSHFLSFPKTFQLEPHQAGQVEFTVTIPYDHPGNVELNPMLYATQFGEQGGATIINIQMLKIPSIIIAPNDNPQFRSNTAYDQSEQTTNNMTSSSNPTTNVQNGKGLTVVQNTAQQTTQNQPHGGGCLIATAAYGSELAAPVQMLREIRDTQLFGTQSGTSFMNAFNKFYYSFSPTVADWERENPVFREYVLITITPLITTLSLLQYVPINSEITALGFGIGLIILNIGIYFVAPTWAILKVKNYFAKKHAKNIYKLTS